MFQRYRVLFFVLLIALLSGCWIPEKFDAKVEVNKDGSYKFTYDGTLTFALALAAAQKGALSAQDEAAFKKEGDKISHEPGFKKVEYLGKGRYKVLVEKIGKPGEPYFFMSKELKFFSILPQKDGVISIAAIHPDQKSIQELNSIGAKIDGTLTVTVANGAKVLKQNAQSEPSAFGLFGGYKWQIKSSDETPPLIVIQPAP